MTENRDSVGGPSAGGPSAGGPSAGGPSDDAPATASGAGSNAGAGAGAGSVSDATSVPDDRQRAADAEILTERGVDLCRKARWRDAIEPLKRATELAPNSGLAFYYLGDAYNHTDQLPVALLAFEAASRLLTDNWRALKGVGIVLDRMRRPQEAAAAYQKARDAHRE